MRLLKDPEFLDDLEFSTDMTHLNGLNLNLQCKQHNIAVNGFKKVI